MCSASVVRPNIFLFFWLWSMLLYPFVKVFRWDRAVAGRPNDRSKILFFFRLWAVGTGRAASRANELGWLLERNRTVSGQFACTARYAIIPLLKKISSLNKSLIFLESIVFVFLLLLRNILESNVDCSRTKLSKDIRRPQAKDLVLDLIISITRTFNLKSLTQRFQRIHVGKWGLFVEEYWWFWAKLKWDSKEYWTNSLSGLGWAGMGTTCLNVARHDTGTIMVLTWHDTVRSKWTRGRARARHNTVLAGHGTDTTQMLHGHGNGTTRGTEKQKNY